MKNSLDRNIILASSSHSIYDDMIYFRYAKSLIKSYQNVYVIGIDEDNYKLDETNIGFYKVPKRGNRFTRFILNPRLIMNYIKQFDPEETIVFLFSIDLVIFGEKLVKNGFHVVQVYVENYKRKLLYRKWIPSILRKKVASFVNMKQANLGMACEANIFVDSLTMEEQGSNINNPILLPNYPIEIEKSTQNIRSFESPVKCVYVGSISSARGLYIIMRLIENTSPNDISLTIYGSCINPTEKEKLMSFVESHNNVYYKGNVPYSKVLTILENYDIGLAFYERTEAYSYIGENTTKLFEYMQVGLPVITQDFPVLKRIIEEEDNAGACFNTDEDNWIEEFRRLILDRDRLLEMSENGKRAYKEKRNWVCCEIVLNNLMRNL